MPLFHHLARKLLSSFSYLSVTKQQLPLFFPCSSQYKSSSPIILHLGQDEPAYSSLPIEPCPYQINMLSDQGKYKKKPGARKTFNSVMPKNVIRGADEESICLSRLLLCLPFILYFCLFQLSLMMLLTFSLSLILTKS